MQRVEEDSGIEMGPGTVYGSIQRLEDRGMVEEREDRGGARRRVYALTQAGREALEAEATRLRRLAALARDRRVAADPA